MPAVSVIMPAFNVEGYLAEAIDSVLGQTYRDYELVIVDDGSTDGTRAVAERYAAGDPDRVRLIVQPNGGLAAARNTAIAAASGEYFALLDSDDTWDPTFLAEQMAIFESRPGVAVVTGNARYLGGPRDGEPARPVPDPRPAISLLELIKDETAVYIMSVFRRRVVERVGRFDESLRTNEDYDFWLRAALAGFRFARNPVPLGRQRRRDDSLSADDLRMITGVLKVYRKLQPQLAAESAERAALDAQIARFEAEALAAEARRGLRAGDYATARAKLAELRTRRPSAKIALAAAALIAAPSLVRTTYEANARLRAARQRRRRRTAAMDLPVVIKQGRPTVVTDGPPAWRKALSARAHALDHAVGRLIGPRRVIIEARTPVHLAVLRPVYERLMADPRVSVQFIGEDHPEMAHAFRDAGLADRVLPRLATRWQRFDLYMNADPWNRMSLRRCARRMNFFHGVAGKYDLDCPADLPMGFDRYDRVAFVNTDRMTRYLNANIVSQTQAVLVGYPKIDALVNGSYDGAEIRRQLGLDPERPTIVYAPTYSPASSLHLAGEAIVTRLLADGYNVIAKLHDRSFDPADNYSAGIDWRQRFAAIAVPGRFALAKSGDSAPYLVASDLMVTDHSSVGFEFCVLDRPLVVFDAPDLVRVARINPEKVAQLRRAADVVADVDALSTAVRQALAAPAARSAERRQLTGAIFHRPGTAAERATAVAYELLNLSPRPNTVPVTASGRPEANVA